MLLTLVLAPAGAGTVAAATPSASADGTSSAGSTLTISGPAVAPRNSLVTIRGTATLPGSAVVIWFHHHGQPSGLYLPSRTATSDAAGNWSTTFTLAVDFQYFATTGGLRSALILTKAASLTINRGPATVVLGGTVTISGTALPAYSTVSVYFHKAGDPLGVFGIHRTTRSSLGGTWSTTYAAEADETYYAAANGLVSSRQTTLAAQPNRPVVYRFPVDPPTVTSYARVHHDYPATDIFAPCGSRMVAVTGGVVQEVSRVDVWNPATDDPAVRGGLSISLVGDDGVRYYAAHLLDILPGVAPGARVVAGQLLGHVGETGNARGLGCHVHFGISPPCGPGEWSIRRGTFYPWPYLDSWRAGGQLSPVAAMNSWRAAHLAECAAHRLAGT
ncbi:murein DD-endopeptidase MepM/ murein hydrolase activator NlpD [Nakamurella sp. UYEF19]|uniref:M23 family metallopeptidase n=1 Tax=Nakamurella sp. UYEF19 TaxID=1756392 RepID=UPI003399E07B